MKRIFVFLGMFCFAHDNKSVGQTLNRPSNTSIASVLPAAPTVNTPSLTLGYNQGANSAPTTFNFYRNWVPLIPITNLNDPTFDVAPTGMAYNKAILVSSYYNGFGQPLETIIRKGGKDCSSCDRDIIYFSDNRLSSSSMSFLPYSISPYSKFQMNPSNGWLGFYSGDIENGFQFSKSEVVPFFSGGASNPIPTVKTYMPGSAFVGSDRKQVNQTTYDDGTNYIKILKINSAGVPELGTNNNSTANTYISGHLRINSNVNEHNNVQKSFYNRDGQLVCKKDNSLTTYYVYNDLGQLVYVLPPKAVEAFNATSINWDFTLTSAQQVLKNLCFKYVYDKYGRIVKQSIPGKSTDELFIYDSKGRLLLSQTPLMASSHNWNFNVYDLMNRVVMSGIFTDPEQLSREDLQSRIDNVNAWPGNITFQPLIGYFWNGITGSLPTTITNCDIHTYNYYDHYNHATLGTPSFDLSFSSDYLTNGADKIIPTNTPFAYGYLTGSKVKILDNTSSFSNQWITSVYFYDEKHNLIQTQTLNPWNTSQKDIITNQYDFSGNLVLEIFKHYYTSGSTKPNTKIQTKYQYDVLGNGRLNGVFHKIDNDPWRSIINTVDYDYLGRIRTLGIGTIEQQDFKYNIRGQLKSINENYVGTNTLMKSFGEVLCYDYGFTVPRYDGNLSGVVWRGSGNSDPRAYGYDYDNSYRMNHAEFSERIYTAPGYTGPAPAWNKTNNDFTVSSITYDPNGNLLTMNQRGVGLVGGSSTPVDMDLLSYTYNTNSNQLTKVEDGVNKTTNAAYLLGDFINNITDNSEYAFDADGNMAKDLNKDVSNIAYNYNDLPLSVTVTKGTTTNTIENIYDAGGVLLKKKITDGTTTTIYEYWGPFVYKNGSLEHVRHDAGRARIAASGGVVYDYFIKDHLGNVRNVIAANIVNGVQQYHAGWEINVASVEEMIFQNIGEVRDNKPSASPQDLMSGKLNGSIDSQRIGAAILLHCMAGDQLNLKGYGYYEEADSSDMNTYATPEDVLNSLITTLENGQNGIDLGENGIIPGLAPGTLQALLSPTNYNIYDNLKAGITDPDYPRAYLNYLVFNEQMELQPDYCNVIQLQGSANTWHLLDRGTTLMPINGFIAVFLSNESNMDVYVDNETLTSIVGGLLEEQHYYPHGLPVKGGGQNTTPLVNKYLFESNVLQDELGLHLSDFNFRNYDHQLGRFTSVDLLSDFLGQETQSPYHFVWNNPTNSTDPLGLGNGNDGNMNVSNNTEDLFVYPMFSAFMRKYSLLPGLENADPYPTIPAFSDIRPRGGPYKTPDTRSFIFSQPITGAMVYYGDGFVGPRATTTAPFGFNGGPPRTVDNTYVQRVRPTGININNSYNSPTQYDPTGLQMAQIGFFLEVGQGAMYNKSSWYSLKTNKRYTHGFNGNKHTGGKYTHARKVSNYLKYGGFAMGIYGSHVILDQYNKGEITQERMQLEQTINFISTVGGVPGASFGLGWALGGALTSQPWYRRSVRPHIQDLLNIPRDEY